MLGPTGPRPGKTPKSPTSVGILRLRDFANDRLRLLRQPTQAFNIANRTVGLEGSQMPPLGRVPRPAHKLRRRSSAMPSSRNCNRLMSLSCCEMAKAARRATMARPIDEAGNRDGMAQVGNHIGPEPVEWLVSAFNARGFASNRRPKASKAQ